MILTYFATEVAEWLRAINPQRDYRASLDSIAPILA